MAKRVGARTQPCLTKGFVLRWPWDQSQGQGQWKWYTTVEVNGTKRHGKYEKNWLNSLRVTPNVKVFARQDGRKDEHDSLRNRYGTDMDQKESRISLSSLLLSGVHQ